MLSLALDLASMNSSWWTFYHPLTFQCSAYSASASSETTWTMRATFPEYVVALATIVGSVLFTVCQSCNSLSCCKVFRFSSAYFTHFQMQFDRNQTYVLRVIFKWLFILILTYIGNAFRKRHTALVWICHWTVLVCVVVVTDECCWIISDE